jgi:peptidoglycan/xylan/chitin deacetylase (PgdA/CDA1 family)
VNDLIKRSFAKLAWQASQKLKPLWPRNTVVLEYHGIPKVGYDQEIDSVVFEKHLTFLKQHYEIVPWSMLWQPRKRFDKVRVLLTFDDGFRNHCEVVAPLLRKYNVPAIFFVPSRHCSPGKYLWFNYLLALERHFQGNGFLFRGEFVDMSGSRRRQSIQRLRALLLSLKSHPDAMYRAIEQELPRLEDFVDNEDLNNRFAGMTSEQLAELASDSFFTVGAHTVDHPLLTQCTQEEASNQMANNKLWIERITQKSCDSIAYPGGDYDEDILKICRQLNFGYGYVEGVRLSAVLNLEIPRLGIYSESTDVLAVKIEWGLIMRSFHLDIG